MWCLSAIPWRGMPRPATLSWLVSRHGCPGGSEPLQDLDVRLASALWRPTQKVGRSFVTHRHAEAPPGWVWQEGPAGGPVRLTVVIPTVDAQRGGYFLQLLRQI